MYNIIFYKDQKGNQPVLEYIRELQAKGDKDSRIKVNKIFEYLSVVEEVGTRAGLPYVKFLGDGLWEIRPNRDRIIFFGWEGNNLVMLHHFMKTTQKTPPREIDKAKRHLKDFLGQND